MKHEDLTNKIIQAFYKVYNTLGCGFLEKVYQNALVIELKKIRLRGRVQVPIDVFYEVEKVGFYVADVLIEEIIILELKAGDSIVDEHEAQLINYLKATNVEVGLLLGFCKSPIVKRKFFDNELKQRGNL